MYSFYHQPMRLWAVIRSKIKIFVVVLGVVFLFGCGGNSEVGTSPSTTGFNFGGGYVGRWTSPCKSSPLPTRSPPDPDGLSDDEVLTVTQLGNKQLSITSVNSTYNNMYCSTTTSFYRSFDNVSIADVVDSSTTGAVRLDRLVLKPIDGSAQIKALARATDQGIFLTRSNLVGIALDAEEGPRRRQMSA
jgi:hypothetical protein